jgi:hypothetical protein
LKNRDDPNAKADDQNAYLKKRDQSQRILKIVKEIAKALVEHTKHKKVFKSEAYLKF